MTRKCPICGTLYTNDTSDLVIPHLNKRRLRMYYALMDAPKGLTPVELGAHMYGIHQKPTSKWKVVLRVQICEINKILRPHGYIISCGKDEGVYNGVYRLRPIGSNNDGSEEGSAAQETAA